ncbi:InlB B-repeat-containing protein [Dokdonella ginsengisoli]|uniref:InlB B-repeat-containing protein n=1 Tax=Dokdonella ginsengisoli TaxID=363846 RepID=UPI0036D2AEBE
MKSFVSRFILFVGIVFASQAGAAGLGEPDPSFGDGGTQTVAFNLAGDLPGGQKHDIAWAMAKSPDGRIYQAGALDNGGGTFKLGLTRFSPDGAVDFSFGVGGKITYQHPGLTSLLVLDMVFHPTTGRFLVTGAATRTGSPDVGMLTCRFYADGSIDTTFATTGPDPLPGCRFIKMGEHAVAKSLVIQPSGRVVIAGYTVVNGLERAVIARLLPNGALDDGLYGVEFGDNGIRIPFPATPKGNLFEDLALSPDGTIVAVGTFDVGGDSSFLVARFNDYGVLDQSLKGIGVTAVQFNDGGANQDKGQAVHVFDDNSILVLGNVEHANGFHPALLRLKQDGTPDDTFGPNQPADGKSIFKVCNNCNVQAWDFRVHPNGWIYVGGAYSSIGMFAARFNAGGLVDLGWNQNQGFTIVDFGGQPADTAFRVDLQGSRLVLSGATDTGGAAGLNYAIARLDHGSGQLFAVTPKVAAPGGGTIAPNAVQPVIHSGHVAFTVAPSPNRTIQKVTGCGGALIGNVYTTAPVTDDCTVTAYFSTNVELNYYAGAGGWLQGDVAHIVQNVPYGGSGTQVQAFAAEGFQFKRWSDGNLNNPRIDVNVTQNKSVEAEFEVRSYKVALVPTPAAGGTVTPDVGQLIEHGSKGLFTIAPKPGYGVAGIGGCGSVGSLVGNVYQTVPVTENCIAPVNFAASDAHYTLRYRQGLHCALIDADPNGLVEQVVASGHDGDFVKVTGQPGYVFLKWSDGSTDPIRKDDSVFDHLDVTAECVAENSLIHTVTPVSGSGGALSPVASVLVADGYVTKFEVLPSEGFAIDSVSGCGAGTLEGNVYTTGKVTTDCAVEASFVATDAQYSLQYAPGIGGEVEGTAVQVVKSGGWGTPVEAVPHPGRVFLQWSDGVTDNPRQDKYVIADVEVTAEFAEAGALTVTPFAGLGGTIAPDKIQVVKESDVLAFVVTPVAGYAIAGVSGCSGTLDGKTYTTGAIAQSCMVQAWFEPTDEAYLLKYAAGPNGSLDNGQPVVEASAPSGGDGPWVTAVPADGYVFVQWSDGVAQNPRQDTGVVADVDVVAQFVPEGSLIVTPIVEGVGGTLDPSLKQVVSVGELAQFAVLPLPGFAIDEVAGTCGGALVGKLYTTVAVTQSCTVKARFKPSGEMFALKYEAGPNGTVNGGAEVLDSIIAGGTGPDVFAEPEPGYVFTHWSDGSQQNPRVDANLVGPISVIANFAPEGSVVVTPKAGLGGSIEPWIAQVVNPGTAVAFQVLPGPGFAIAGVAGTCGGQLAGKTFTTVPVAQHCTVEADFVPSQAMYSLKYTAGANGKVNDQAVVSEPHVIAGGTGPEVMAQPDPGYVFVQWSDGVTDNPRIDANLIGDVDVTAIFAVQGSLTVTPVVIGGVGGALSPGDVQIVAPGAIVQFEVLPQPGYAIGSSQSDCGGMLVGKLYTTAPIAANCAVEVAFVPSDATFTLTYMAGENGSIDNGQDVVVASNVPAGGSGPLVTATPDPGYFFVTWSDGSTENPRVDASIVGDVDVTAIFAPQGWRVVTPSVIGFNGFITPNLPQAVAPGESAVFTVSPHEGFAIGAVEGTCGGSLQGKLFTTQPVAENCTVVASFVPSDATYHLVYSTNGNGWVNLQDFLEFEVPSGGTGPMIEASPFDGYSFVGWSDGSTDNPRIDANVVAGLDVVALFAPEGSVMVTPVVVGGFGGSLQPGDAQFVPIGGTTQFTLLPSEGHAIGSVGGTCGGSLAGKLYTTDPVTDHCTVEVSFVESDAQYMLTYVPGPGGEVIGEQVQQVISGGTGSPVKAQPLPGHFFVKWSDGWMEDERQDANVVSDIEVTAQFAADGTPVWTVTPSWEGGGTLLPNAAFPVIDGEAAVLTVAPNLGFGIGSVSGCGGQLVGNQYVTAPVAADCEVHAVFVASEATYTLTYTAGANGQVNGAAQVQFAEVPSGGAGDWVTATPAAGYAFVKWSDGSTDNPRQDTNVVSDLDVTAQFATEGASVWTVTSSAGAGGTVSPLGDVQIVDGETAQFTITPNDGFAIGPIDGTCGGVLQGNVFTTNPVIGDCTVEVTFVQGNAQFTLTYVAGPNGAINGDLPMLSQNVPAGGDGPLVTATPAAGYAFVKWSDGSTDNPRQDTNVAADVEVTAQFVADGTPIWTVTPSWEGSGTLLPNAAFPVVDGDNAVLTMAPDLGFGVGSIAGCDGQPIGNQYVTAPVTADCEVHAVFFASNATYTLTYTAGAHGQVNGAPQVQFGGIPSGGDGPAAVDAQPAAGYVFVAWSDGSTDNPRLDTHVMADIDVTAQFAPVGTPIHLVTPKWSLGGALNPAVDVPVAEGGSAQFTLVPQNGYGIVDVGGSCGGSRVGNVYTTDPIVADCTVEAAFAPSAEIFSVTYIAGPNGTINGNLPMLSQNVQAGGDGPLVTATPAVGYAFVKWSDGNTDNPRQDTHVAGDIEVTAQFAEIGAQTWTVTSSAAAGGTVSPIGDVQVVDGETAQFTITPNDGYAVESVGGTCGGSRVGNVFTTNPVTGPCTVEIAFVYDRIFGNGFDAGGGNP